MAYSGKVWQVIDRQVMNGEEMLNVYFYKNDDSEGNAEDVARAFNEDVIFALIAMQSADIEHREVEVQSLFALDDNYTLGVGTDGEIGTEAFPSAVAINFTLRPASREVRPGSKRIAGIPESAGNHNVVNDSTYLLLVEPARVALESNIAYGVTPLTEYIPCVVKRIPYTTPGGNPAYRLPADGSEAEVFSVTGALFTNVFSHQTSRGN